jgi:hypothetical protein
VCIPQLLLLLPLHTLAFTEFDTPKGLIFISVSCKAKVQAIPASTKVEDCLRGLLNNCCAVCLHWVKIFFQQLKKAHGQQIFSNHGDSCI